MFERVIDDENGAHEQTGRRGCGDGFIAKGEGSQKNGGRKHDHGNTAKNGVNGRPEIDQGEKMVFEGLWTNPYVDNWRNNPGAKGLPPEFFQALAKNIDRNAKGIR